MENDAHFEKDVSDSDPGRTIIMTGRVERKMKRKHRVELSLKIDGVERTQTLHVAKDGSSLVQHPACVQLQALVRAVVVPKPDTDDDRSWVVRRLDLLECPSDPLAVKAVLKERDLWNSLQPYEEGPVDNNLMEDYEAANHAMVKRIVMRLQHRTPTQPRTRPPHVSFKLMKALEELEHSIELVDVHISSAEEPQCDTTESIVSTGWNLPETEDDRVLISARHKLTRQEYLESKKHPQIAWMQKRLLGFPGQPLRHVVDVGGGRGDLAIALALGLGAETRVTVVDLNESSLEAGRRYAEICGVADRMEWVCNDFTSFASESLSSDVDVVVALHACGNLSDLALDYAVRQNAAFLICPCCYSKMEQQTAASRLAEISELPDLSRRGMHVVNSKRYWDLMAHNSYYILLEEYSRTWSSRNMVLVGWPRS